MEAVSDQAVQKRVRRRTFLIDRKFQLKYTLIIVLVGVMVSAVLGYFVYDLSLENTKMAVMDAKPGSAASAENLALIDPEYQKELTKHVSRFDTQVIIYLAVFVGVMALSLFIWGIFITHRVAGPIFIISRYLSQISQGQIPHTRPLRRGDELKEFFDTVSQMVGSLRQRNLKEADILQKSAGEIRKQGGVVLAATAKTLEDLAQEKKTWGEPQAG